MPQAGNAGYDVLHYDITLRCDPKDGSLEGITVVEARALADLREFHLDLVDLEVEDVRVDGAPAAYRRLGQELIIECAETLRTGSGFSVAVEYSGTPRRMQSADGYSVGWQHSGETIFTLDEPQGGATWFPLNDHPSDKATYSFNLTVPSSLHRRCQRGAKEHSRCRCRPDFLLGDGAAHGQLSGFCGGGGAGAGGDGFSRRGAHTQLLRARGRRDGACRLRADGRDARLLLQVFGPYPFDVYGVVVPDANTEGSAMENQTISLFGRDTLERSMSERPYGEMFVAHELAHQWFGNSVTLERWKDVWLNEGFATYASWLWFEHELGDKGMEAWVVDAYDSLRSEDETAPGDPGVEGLFGVAVYERGGLTLHALREAIGDDRFFAILREWVSENAYGNVGTEDFDRTGQGEDQGARGVRCRRLL